MQMQRGDYVILKIGNFRYDGVEFVFDAMRKAGCNMGKNTVEGYCDIFQTHARNQEIVFGWSDCFNRPGWDFLCNRHYSSWKREVTIPMLLGVSDKMIRKGCYVRTKGLDDKTVERLWQKFSANGCPRKEFCTKGSAWEYHGWTGEGWMAFDESSFFHHEMTTLLSVEDVLQTKTEGETTMGKNTDLLNSLKDAHANLKDAQDAFDKALEAVRQELGEDFKLETKTPTNVASNPHEWENGDVVRCIRAERSYFTNGKEYTLTGDGIDHDGDIEVLDNDGDHSYIHHTHVEFVRKG